MSMSFHVIVFRDGDPRPNVRVTADFGFSGQAKDRTDKNGLATIHTSGNYTSAEIFVDGSNEGSFAVGDGKTIKIDT